MGADRGGCWCAPGNHVGALANGAAHVDEGHQLVVVGNAPQVATDATTILTKGIGGKAIAFGDGPIAVPALPLQRKSEGAIFTAVIGEQFHGEIAGPLSSVHFLGRVELSQRGSGLDLSTFADKAVVPGRSEGGEDAHHRHRQHHLDQCESLAGTTHVATSINVCCESTLPSSINLLGRVMMGQSRYGEVSPDTPSTHIGPAVKPTPTRRFPYAAGRSRPTP